MAHNVSVYKGCNRLGTGTMTNGSATVSSYTAGVAGNSPAGKNVSVTITSGSAAGSTMWTRILVDGTTTLTLKDPDPFTDT